MICMILIISYVLLLLTTLTFNILTFYNLKSIYRNQSIIINESIILPIFHNHHVPHQQIIKSSFNQGSTLTQSQSLMTIPLTSCCNNTRRRPISSSSRIDNNVVLSPKWVVTIITLVNVNYCSCLH